MRNFRYYRAASIGEASRWLSADSEAMAIAGGQTLLPTLRLRLASPSALVDLGHIAGLTGVRGEDRKITVGAMARHTDVANSREMIARIPVLAHLAGGIGDRQVRNRGTIGGSLANNDPAACYPAATLALRATIHTNNRALDSDEYFRGLFATALAPAELITAVTFCVPEAAAYAKFPHPASRFSLVGVFIARFSDEVRVVVTGAGARGVFRVSQMESTLAQRWRPEELHSIPIDLRQLMSDIHASAEYRARLVQVMAARAAKAM